MANTGNIGAGKPAVAGGIYACLTSAIKDDTPLPTDATTDMSTLTHFKSLGYISEDGVTNENSPETEDTKSWDGATVSSIQTSKEDTFSWKMLEVLNEDVLKLLYGSANVTTASGATTIEATTDEMEAYAYVIDMIIGEKAQRIVIPNAKVNEVSEMTYSGSEVVGYEITVTAMPDPAREDKTVTHYTYIK